ncbi:helix-turn-helix domain-containing protein [Paenibacillus larvae]|uniref:Helix-turn-helix domain-containing protein n=1 Tax=Paenibacillus larvae subsp. larvae TaxID=147375 RepID=A0A6C0QVJ1_9BACL|nr:hypothetical protein ERICV_03256 [Paenibacillus larvae subsp. larvae]
MNNNLMSVESQTEYSITSGQTETRIFIKFYVDAVRSGMVADIGPERLQTLIVLASYMNERGECYPTQEMIAKSLGISRESATRRIRSLRKYKWKGRNLIEVKRTRDPQTQAWANTIYTILPVSNLGIFDGDRK